MLCFVLLLVFFLLVLLLPRTNFSENGDDEEIDWKHKNGALKPDHHLVPGDREPTCGGESGYLIATHADWVDYSECRFIQCVLLALLILSLATLVLAIISHRLIAAKASLNYNTWIA